MNGEPERQDKHYSGEGFGGGGGGGELDGSDGTQGAVIIYVQ